MKISSRSKKKMIENALENGMVSVFLDGSHHFCDLPKHCIANKCLKIHLSLKFESALAFEEDGIATTLSFGGINHFCFLPYEAIWGVGKESPDCIWTGDLPEEALEETLTEGPSEENEEALEKAPTPVTNLSSFKASHQPPTNNNVIQFVPKKKK